MAIAGGLHGFIYVDKFILSPLLIFILCKGSDPKYDNKWFCCESWKPVDRIDVHVGGWFFTFLKKFLAHFVASGIPNCKFQKEKRKLFLSLKNIHKFSCFINCR